MRLEPQEKNSDGVYTLSLDGHEITVSVVAEHDSKREADFVFAARYETKLSGSIAKTFTVGSIGTGTSREDAIETSIDEWGNLFGRSLAASIARKEGAHSVGKFLAFPGATGFRGEVPDHGLFAKEDSMHEKILRVVTQDIGDSAADFTLVNMLVSVDERGQVAGECRLDNEVSVPMFASLRGLGWPTSKGPYLFKQIYIIRKK